MRPLLMQMKASIMAPLLTVAVHICLVFSIILMVEKTLMGAISLYAKIFRRRPERIYKCDPIKEDEELGTSAFPMVLVQIPMYNEMQVYKLSIGAACRLRWPSERLIVQVLDDSTDLKIRSLVKQECKKWVSNGVNVKYEIRDNRYGYKAGAMKEGMKHSYVDMCEFIAIFDADFQPEPDYLMRTIPFLFHNPSIALVQTRWIFVNSNECLMTRMQEMSMDYHFKVEQEAGSTLCNFFGFNGTAGVWRISAMNDAGGWNERTTVEDMDLAVRTSLRGWKFIYAGNIKVKSELPNTFKAFRNQQYRWACGPANLFRKTFGEILRTKDIRQCQDIAQSTSMAHGSSNEIFPPSTKSSSQEKLLDEVPPAELEQILQSNMKIADAAVIPYLDEEVGEIPMAYVVRQPGCQISEKQVMAFVANQVAPYKKIRKVAFVSSIPKSPAGKILRRELVKHALSKPKSKL